MFIPHTKVLSVKVCTLPKNKIKQKICHALKGERGIGIFTPNTQMLLSANKDGHLCKLLNSSSINIPDGVGIRLAAKLSEGIDLAKISGIDLAEELLPVAEKLGTRIFLLGGKDGIARVAKKNLLRRFPSLNICGTYHGYFSQGEEKAVIDKINSSGAELLLVCMGFPRQEKWIAKNLPSLSSVRVASGLGGTLDVWAQRTRRAPKAMQKTGLEWLWRVILEPSRAKIFIDIPRFFLLLAKEKKQIY